MLSLAAALAARGDARARDRDGGERLAALAMRSHVVIRIETVRPRQSYPLGSAFREKKGPPCLAMGDVAGAAVIAPNAVDLVMKTGERMRARFAASCPGLDYYSGFYLAPTADGKLCAGRDVVRDRAGGECAVERIRVLTPRH